MRRLGFFLVTLSLASCRSRDTRDAATSAPAASSAEAVDLRRSPTVETTAAPDGTSPTLLLVVGDAGPPRLSWPVAVDDRWATTPPVIENELSWGVGIRRDVDPERLPAEVGAWRDARVSVIDEEGAAHHGRVAAVFILLRDYDFPEQDRDHWRRLGGDRTRDPWAKSAAAREWQKHPEQRELALEVVLDEPRGEANLVWGQRADLPIPRFAPLRDAPAAVTSAVSAAIRGHSLFLDVERRHQARRRTGMPEHWWERTSYEEHVSVATLGTTTVAVGTARTCEGYGGFTVNLESAWLVEGPPDTPSVTTYLDVENAPEMYLRGIADANRDGMPDLVLMDGLALSHDRRLERLPRAQARVVHTCPGAGQPLP